MFGRRENILRSLNEWRNLKRAKVWAGNDTHHWRKIWGSQLPWAFTHPSPFQGSQLPVDLASTEVISRNPRSSTQEFPSEYILFLEGDLRNKQNKSYIRLIYSWVNMQITLFVFTPEVNIIQLANWEKQMGGYLHFSKYFLEFRHVPGGVMQSKILFSCSLSEAWHFFVRKGVIYFF